MAGFHWPARAHADNAALYPTTLIGSFCISVHSFSRSKASLKSGGLVLPSDDITEE